MWIDESSDPNRFMTVEERYKYVGAITESALDEAVIDAESASRVLRRNMRRRRPEDLVGGPCKWSAPR